MDDWRSEAPEVQFIRTGMPRARTTHGCAYGCGRPIAIGETYHLDVSRIDGDLVVTRTHLGECWSREARAVHANPEEANEEPLSASELAERVAIEAAFTRAVREADADALAAFPDGP